MRATADVDTPSWRDVSANEKPYSITNWHASFFRSCGSGCRPLPNCSSSFVIPSSLQMFSSSRLIFYAVRTGWFCTICQQRPLIYLPFGVGPRQLFDLSIDASKKMLFFCLRWPFSASKTTIQANNNFSHHFFLPSRNPSRLIHSPVQKTWNPVPLCNNNSCVNLNHCIRLPYPRLIF